MSVRTSVQRLKTEIEVYRLVLRHPDTPRLAKMILGAAVAYAVSPIDLIPDFIPVIGHLDDVLIVPLLAWLGIRLVPRRVIDECRGKVISLNKNKTIQVIEGLEKREP